MAIDLFNINPWIFLEEMIDFTKINQLTLEDLGDVKLYHKFLYTLASPEYQNDPKVISLAIFELENLIKKYPQFIEEFPEMHGKYQEIVIYLKFQSLAIQPINTILDLFKNHLIFAIESQIDLKGKLKFLFIIYDYAVNDWEKNRMLIVKAFKENEEKIGFEKIKIDQEEREPMIKNWLVDYITFRDLNRETRTLGRTIYLNQSINVRKIEPKEKEILTKILEIYDYLNLDLKWQVVDEGNGLISFKETSANLIINNLSVDVGKEKQTNFRPPMFREKSHPRLKSFEEKYIEDTSSGKDDDKK